MDVQHVTGRGFGKADSAGVREANNLKPLSGQPLDAPAGIAGVNLSDNGRKELKSILQMHNIKMVC